MALQRQAHFGYLLIGLLIFLIAGPVVNEFTDQSIIIVTRIGFSVTLIIGIWSLTDSRKWFMVGMVLVAVEIASTVANLLRPSLITETFSLLVALCFCALSLAIALRHVLFDQRMDLNRLIGGICAYLLLGIIVSILNRLVYQFIPHSFSGLPDTVGPSSGMDLLYYSFVTLTTLGYGDITPEGSIAQVLAYLAAIAGQFYIAILVGTLVGMYLSQQNRED